MAKEKFEKRTRVDLQIHAESLELLDGLLSAAGLTRNGFYNTITIKFVEALELKKIPDINKMSIPQLFKLMGALGKLLEEKK